MIQISLPYNKSFAIIARTNADWIQRVVIKDIQNNHVFGPYSGQGNGTQIAFGDIVNTRVSSGNENENGFLLNVTVTHLNVENGNWEESKYKIYPLGSSIYLRISTEDRDEPEWTDFNDCTIEFKTVIA